MCSYTVSLSDSYMETENLIGVVRGKTDFPSYLLYIIFQTCICARDTEVSGDSVPDAFVFGGVGSLS